MRDDFSEEQERYGGIRRKWKFPNGFGASVIRHQYSYGGPSYLWELAILGKDDSLCYDTEITDDVIGHLTEDEVDEILRKIENLPEAP